MSRTKCISCNRKLKSASQFTGTDISHKSHYVVAYFCPNDKCIRYNLHTELTFEDEPNIEPVQTRKV